MPRSSVPLHFVEHGSGTPVLALHGWTPDHRLMTGCLEPVFSRREGYRRLYPDLPGMGRTPAPADLASSDDLLAAVDGFIQEQLGDEPFLLVGESYGGYLARAVAGARRDQVLGLTLICPLRSAVPKSHRTIPAPTVLVEDPELVAGLEAKEAEEFTGVAVVQTPETLRRFRQDVAPGLAVADSEAMGRIYQRWQLTTPLEGETQFTGPTLILTGRQDWSTGYADIYPLLDHYPRASFAILDRAGHNLQFEQPQLFEALLSEWLDRVESALHHSAWSSLVTPWSSVETDIKRIDGQTARGFG